ncbi:MAG: DNA-binding protein, partial [Prevotella sp.]|nr:DNA-binding protein [Prevotella sp.]
MLKLDLYRNNNESSTKYGRVYSRVNNAKPIDEIGLAKNMHSHYTTFSIGELSGMIRDMAKAIKDNVLQGQPVKLSDLCIFSAHVESDGA